MNIGLVCKAQCRIHAIIYLLPEDEESVENSKPEDKMNQEVQLGIHYHFSLRVVIKVGTP